MSMKRFTRTALWVLCLVLSLQLSAGFARTAGGAARPDPRQPAARAGQHDFDWEIGTWQTRLKRRLRPLTGSDQWVEYSGTTTVTSLWGGRANWVELDVKGSAGAILAGSLRLYNPASQQWSLNFANSAAGTMAIPTVGEFRDGRGEFYSSETLDGRAILVRFVIFDITADAAKFEQSFSVDRGKTWEVNWIATDRRKK